MVTSATIIATLNGPPFGLSDAEIARRCSSTQPTIWRLRTGKTSEAGETLYRSLMALHAKLAAEVSAGETAEAA